MNFQQESRQVPLTTIQRNKVLRLTAVRSCNEKFLKTVLNSEFSNLLYSAKHRQPLALNTEFLTLPYFSINPRPRVLHQSLAVSDQQPLISQSTPENSAAPDELQADINNSKETTPKREWCIKFTKSDYKKKS